MNIIVHIRNLCEIDTLDFSFMNLILYIETLELILIQISIKFMAFVR